MGALGYVMNVPEEEKYLNTKKELEARLVELMAGRAAEEIVFETCLLYTSGILSGVLKQITDTGRAHAHEHFHKVRTGKGIKRHMGLACHCLGKQCLTSSGRAH